jgi:hypothetical protein
VCSTYVDEDERAAGGSTIIVRDNILHSYVNLNTDLQAVAVRITLDKTITFRRRDGSATVRSIAE